LSVLGQRMGNHGFGSRWRRRHEGAPSIPVGVRCFRFYQALPSRCERPLANTPRANRLSRVRLSDPRDPTSRDDHDSLGAPLQHAKWRAASLFAIRDFPNRSNFLDGIFFVVRTQSKLHKFESTAHGLCDIHRAYAPSATLPADSPLLDRVRAIIANLVETGPLPCRPRPAPVPEPFLWALREALNLVTERSPKFRPSRYSLVHMYPYHPLHVLGCGRARDRRDRLGEYRCRLIASSPAAMTAG